jgi:hypothetical protein
MTERAVDALSDTVTGDEPPTITVEATPEGVATAITHLPARIATTSPRRSHPDARPHPPLVEFGATPDLPGGVPPPETGVELQLPADREHLLVAAPLAYYLGATVHVGTETPRLLTPDRELSFDRLPAFQHEAASLFRDAFFLDTLVRGTSEEVGDSGIGLPADPERAFDLDRPPAALREAGLGDRLETYLDADRESLAGARPAWYLSTYADPTDAAARCLPFLLDDLSLIYLPDASDIDEQGLLRRSLDDFYRAPDDVASVDVVAPELYDGELHGWLAEGVPVSAFTPSPAAYEHRLAAEAAGPQEDLSVAVVLNDAAMADEHDDVARTCRERAGGHPASVEVHESLRTVQLARVLERDHDFLHFIGHCEVSGLQCPDGGLDCESLSRSGARTFFLNACGSYYQGRALVEAGSVAGAVTLRTVLNRQAATVGTTFARLLTCGFGIERAVQLARRQILMSTDYAVVGDGTYAVADGEPTVVEVEPTGEGFAVTYGVPPEGAVGAGYRAPFEDGRRPRGTPAEATLDRTALADLLADRWCPVVYDGALRWPNEVLEKFP